MKRKIIGILGVLLIVAVAWMVYHSVKGLYRKQSIQEKQSDLSKMCNELGHSDFRIKSSTILIFFNSECEHCRWEVEEISHKIDQFSQYQLLLASFEPKHEAITFLDQYGLSNHYIKSEPEKVMEAFTGALPQTLIYQNGKLVKHFKGEVKTEAILESLR